MGVTINKVNNNRTTALEGQQPKPSGGFNAFYWYQIFALGSAVVAVQQMFSSHGNLNLLFVILKRGIQDFHMNYVLAPAVKATNNAVGV